MIEDYWVAFQQKTGIKAEYEAWAFGNTPGMADKLLALVLAGKKTATCSAKELYAFESEEAYPAAGEYSVLLDGSGLPKAVILTTKVETLPFNEVSEEFAYLEGEGDRSLAYWRDVHREFFSQAYQKLDLEFHDTIPCLCETFKVIEWE